MISIQEALEVHALLIARFGGSAGVRDFGMLESSLSRPFQQFDGKELYPSVLLKAASLIESILINHPFIDGNKRVGYMLLRWFLLKNGMDIHATQEEKYRFIIGIASGEIQFESIFDWLSQYTRDA
jgi:death-on-curing protein